MTFVELEVKDNCSELIKRVDSWVFSYWYWEHFFGVASVYTDILYYYWKYKQNAINLYGESQWEAKGDRPNGVFGLRDWKREVV